MIRMAAAGDVHFDRDSAGRMRKHLRALEKQSDIFFIAGDLTQVGHVEEARVLAKDLSGCNIPIVAVLGNHDYHADQQDEIAEVMREVGVHVLEEESLVLTIKGHKLGIYGLKGFGGGFLGASCSDFGEPETKAFIRHTQSLADNMLRELLKMETEHKVVLMHYSPTSDTLLGERNEIYPFLGSYLLAEAIDEGGADVVFHGHAHKGVEKGRTPGGVPVRNVAQHVIQHSFKVYCFSELEDTLIGPAVSQP